MIRSFLLECFRESHLIVHALIRIQLSDISIFRGRMRCYAAGSLYTAFLHLFDTILFIVSLLVAITARINSNDGTYGVHI